jgi:hypothetical protein
MIISGRSAILVSHALSDWLPKQGIVENIETILGVYRGNSCCVQWILPILIWIYIYMQRIQHTGLQSWHWVFPFSFHHTQKMPSVFLKQLCAFWSGSTKYKYSFFLSRVRIHYWIILLFFIKHVFFLGFRRESSMAIKNLKKYNIFTCCNCYTSCIK